MNKMTTATKQVTARIVSHQTLIIKKADVVYAGNYPYTSKGMALEMQDVMAPCEIELDIDMNALVEFMGQRAIRTKGGKATLQGELIKCRVLKRYPLIAERAPRRTDFPATAKFENVRQIAEPLPVASS